MIVSKLNKNLISINFQISRTVATWSPLTAAFNTRPKTQGFNIFGERTGLFKYKELQDSSGFYFLKERSVVEANKLVKEALSKTRNRKIVQIFDDLSDTLCKVADLAEFIRVGHPDTGFASAAEDATTSISGLVEQLNTNRDLYNKLLDIYKNGDIVSTNDIDNHVCNLFLFDFEQSGIHLDAFKRERVVALNEYILHVGSHFMNGTQKPRTVLKSKLSENIRQCFPSDDDSIVVNSLFTDSENDLLREAAYKIFLYPDENQDQLLLNIIDSRRELAQLCGFPSYGHRALRGSLAGTPENVQVFLDTLSEELRPRAAIDYNEMLQYKAKKSKYAKDLMPWDTAYCSARIKKERYGIKTSEICPYFSLGACMEGLNQLFTSLYGISLQVEKVTHGEVWHPDVVKLAVMEDNKILGYIYCDFFERVGKPNQECHFTIQGGRLLENNIYQLPIVVLMLNFPNSTWTSPSLLTPNMVDNLFHEMGHAMHSMLARTPYQHVTGTRCSTDLAEVPSILMEYFASDPRVLTKFAFHYQTGKPIPTHLLEQMIASKKLFSASEAQLQTFYAALDQAYHGIQSPITKSTLDIIANVHNKHYGLPYVPNTGWQLRFGHLVGYGAKYYSYLMSRAVAAWIWQVYFASDPFSRISGERFRKELLAYGGSKPAKLLVQDFLQREVTPESMAISLVHDIDGQL